jgi:hypothetical protein
MSAQHTPVTIVHDFRAGAEMARVASFDEAREWFKQNPEFVPVKRAYLCGEALHKVNAVDRFGPFAHQEISL